MDFSDEQYRDQYRKLDRLIPHNLAWPSSAAIVIRRGSSLRVHGTGTLMRIADQSFLITASHVLETARGSNLQLLVKGTTEGVGLVGKAILSPDHPSDVAAVELSAETVEKLPFESFLRWDHVSFSEIKEDALFVVFGFPEFMSSFEGGRFKLTRFHYMGPVFQGDVSALSGYRPEWHLLLDADDSDVRGNDGGPMRFDYEGGISAPFPKEMHGVSGGSVWRIAESAEDIEQGTARPRLVAVEHAIYHSSKCIQATWWKAVDHLFRTMMPELRPALDMFRGN